MVISSTNIDKMNNSIVSHSNCFRCDGQNCTRSSKSNGYDK